MEQVNELTAGMPILIGGNHVVRVTPELAAAFKPGDRLMVVPETGDLLHVPAAEAAVAARTVAAAVEAFAQMGAVTDTQITDFFNRFADALADDATFAPIAAANADDVDAATAKGRSTTRLVLSDTMRHGMIEGLRGWAAAPSGRGTVRRRIDHDGWFVEEVVDGLGVVGFVFEGRPNVFADATGVLRSGNTVVFRIGSDALGTARAIVDHALQPALLGSGLPSDAARLVDSAAHAAGWAMFADPRLALAVARGSGAAVRQLGAVARQAGNAVSLHGTGGAWIVVAPSAPADQVRAAVEHSLDRKVCNTLNTICITVEGAATHVPAALDGLTRAADKRGTAAKLHVRDTDLAHVDDRWFSRVVAVARADGIHDETQAEPIAADQLGREWEWEDSPEITLAIVETAADAATLFNAQSPRFAASLLSVDRAEHDDFFRRVDAPFVGDGFTRWVDGQYALNAPELGLSNWEGGRLFARGGVLSGDGVHTIRLRVTQSDPELHR